MLSFETYTATLASSDEAIDSVMRQATDFLNGDPAWTAAHRGADDHQGQQRHEDT